LDVYERFSAAGATACRSGGLGNITKLGDWPRAARVFHAMPHDIATALYYTGIDPFSKQEV
jgi:hypothetical protein